MSLRIRSATVVVLLASLHLAGCREKARTAVEEDPRPAKVEHLGGREPARVTLTPKAVDRLGIQTAPARDEAARGLARLVVPYAAVLYDTEGGTWLYTNPSPGVYIRRRITIDQIRSGQATLLDGPTAGTAVVVVGAAELFGSETEFEEE